MKGKGAGKVGKSGKVSGLGTKGNVKNGGVGPAPPQAKSTKPKGK
jgi:hypothetical protein